MARNRGYDVFLSYARVDDQHRMISGLADEMRAVFLRRTGHKLKIFQDRTEIQPSALWRPRIEAALQSSALLVPVISRAYLSSEWCRTEWNKFAAAERGLAASQASRLIFPVLLDGMPKPPKAAIAQSWLSEVAQRQSVDLGGAVPGNHRHDAQVQLLMDGIMAKLHQVNAQQTIATHSNDIEHHDMYGGYVGEGDRFIELLAEAISVTIVGLTNESLAATLSKALARKRRISGDSQDFWRSLRIVFLADQLLDSLNDVLTEFPTPAENMLRRRLAAGFGLRTVQLLLEQVHSSHWQLYESPYQLPFAGTLFEMHDRRTVQLLLRRPQRRTPNQLYMEFDVKPDQYVSGAFEDIVQMSTPLRHIIPIGVPRENGVFRCTGSRFRERILRDGSNEGGWVPVVLVVTWRRHNGRPELWLQLRTPVNAHREINRLAHLANYVSQDDFIAAGAAISKDEADFDLTRSVLVEAAKRCVRQEIGKDPPKGVSAQGRLSHLYPDKENLFFYLFTAELTSDFLHQEEMRSVSVGSLLAARERQALRNAVRVCKRARRWPERAREVGAEIAALNLSLHGHPDLAEQVFDAVGGGSDLDSASKRIRVLRDQTRQVRHADGRMVEVGGIAGLQYREFFATFLPLYEKLGLPEAAEILTAVRSDPDMKRALDRLMGMYRDESVMNVLPDIEV